MIVHWLKRRRTLSRYADNKAVQDFAKVAKDQGAPFDYDPTEKLAVLLWDNSTPDEARLGEIRKLLDE